VSTCEWLIKEAFQQIGELRPTPGIELVGPLPRELQKINSAAVAFGKKEAEAAGPLIGFLASPITAPAIDDTGLEPFDINRGR
jgi:molybdate transport system substrate-binding protein